MELSIRIMALMNYLNNYLEFLPRGALTGEHLFNKIHDVQEGAFSFQITHE